MIPNIPAPASRQGTRIRTHTKSENSALFFGGDAYSAQVAMQQEDLRIWRAKKAAEAEAKALSGEPDEEEEPDEPSFVRPQTPPQGSNYSPWTSYRNLSRTHPVFSYPDEWRERQYKKGVDPVLKAEYDQHRFGKTHDNGKSAKGIAGRLKKVFGTVNNSTLSALS